MSTARCGQCREVFEKTKKQEEKIYYLESELEKQKGANERHRTELAYFHKQLEESNRKILELQTQNEQLVTDYEELRGDTINAAKMLSQAQERGAKTKKSPPLIMNVLSYLPPTSTTASSPPSSRNSARSSTYSLRSTKPRFAVPVFCARNVADLPDIFEVFNNEGKNSDPNMLFHIEKYEEVQEGGIEKLGVVLAMCGTDRVDITDKELLNNLREKKGFSNVIMVILRRGSDPSKFKQNFDATINSGVGKEKGLIQFIHNKGKILLDAATNKANIVKFFEMAKFAFAT